LKVAQDEYEECAEEDDDYERLQVGLMKVILLLEIVIIRRQTKTIWKVVPTKVVLVQLDPMNSVLSFDA
jgi:hypothetical protein